MTKRTPSAVNRALAPFGTTIFSEMTQLALAHDAVNLSQGFPDFEGPPAVVDAAVEALRAGHNQYARSQGHPALVRAVAEHAQRRYGLSYEPLTEVNVFNGCTEAIAAALLGLLEPGDEVVYFEPFYDSYPACVALARAVARPCTLRFPDFALDLEAFAACLTARTRVVLLNTPHNPTGKVFTRAELEGIAALCRDRDLIVITDEVYEHLVYDGAEHVSMAQLPGMRDRTLRLSSAGKTFSFTGWKVGWATGPAHLIAAAQAAHQFLTFCTAPPLQLAVARALDAFDADAEAALRAEFQARRDFLVDVLRAVGFDVAVPRGTYFVLADFGRLWAGDDRSFARHLVEQHGVATIPPSVFYAVDPAAGQRLLRFAFCKRTETLEAAAGRLRGLGGAT